VRRPKLPALGPRLGRLGTLALPVAAVAALFLLAASLGRLDLPPGRPFRLPERAAVPGPVGIGGIELPLIVWAIILALMGVMVLIALVVVLRSPPERKRVGRFLFWALLLAAIGTVTLGGPREPLIVAPTPTPVPGPPAPFESQPAPPGIGPTGVPVTYTPRAAPGWLSFAVALLAVLGVSVLLFGAWRSARVPQNEIADIARAGLDDLRAGRAWEDVVVRCYADMSTALSQRRGIERQQAMTPREFAARLEKAGLPPAAVRTLTHLFERARYGGRQSGPAESQQAIDALQAIMHSIESRR
jgi:hypothetical protein